MVDIKNPISNEIITKGLTVIPKKDRNKLLTYYHFITGHKNYHILHDKIIDDGYYWNNITESCKNFIKECNICVGKNKSKYYYLLHAIKLFAINLENYI